MNAEESDRLDALLHGVDDEGLLATHMDQYLRTSRDCAKRLEKIWEDMGLNVREQEQRLADVTTALSRVWGNAVEQAKVELEGEKAKMDEAVREVYRIMGQLGEGGNMDPSRGADGILRSSSMAFATMRARYNAVLEVLKDWKVRREERLKEFDRVEGEVAKLKNRLGQAVVNDLGAQNGGDISLAALRRLGEDLDRLNGEKLRREREVEGLLSRLRKVCVELGESDVEVASKAHPSLRFYREALPGKFYSAFRSSYSNQPEIRTDLNPEDVEIDLSDGTFGALEGRIQEIMQLKIRREDRANELSQILNNLWDVLGVPEDDIDRGIHKRLLDGPTRLYAKSIDKCMQEVQRLEQAKANLLKNMILEKKAELESLCAETCLPQPDFSPLLQLEEIEGEGVNVGLVADSLAKLTKMVEEVRAVRERRKVIIRMIEDLNNGWVEVEYLLEYKQDDSRYKGRDSNRKLQRALNAEKVRDRMPRIINRLKEEIAEYEQVENSPFVYRNCIYREQLAHLEEQLKQHSPAKKSARPPGRQPSKTRSTTRRPSLPVSGSGAHGSRRLSIRTPPPQCTVSPSPLPSTRSETPLVSAGYQMAGPKRAASVMSMSSQTSGSFGRGGDVSSRDENGTQYNPLQETLNKLLQSAPSTLLAPYRAGKTEDRFDPQENRTSRTHAPSPMPPPSEPGDGSSYNDIMMSGDWRPPQPPTPHANSDWRHATPTDLLSSGDWPGYSNRPVSQQSSHRGLGMSGLGREDDDRASMHMDVELSGSLGSPPRAERFDFSRSLPVETGRHRRV